MASIDEVDRPSPIQYVIEEIVRTLIPKKEFAKSPTVAGVSTSRIDTVLADASSRSTDPNFRFRGMDSASFLNLPDTGAGVAATSWDAIYANMSTRASAVQFTSGRSPDDFCQAFGITRAEWDATYKDMTFDAMITSLEARNASRSPSSTTPAATPAATPTLTPGEVPKNLEGVMPNPGPDVNAPVTPETKAAAEKAAKDAEELAKTDEGMSAWAKLAKRWDKLDPKRKKIIIGGAGAFTAILIVIAVVLAKFLATHGAKICFTKIVTKSSGGVVDFFMTPTEVNCTWEVESVSKLAGPAGRKQDVHIREGDKLIFEDSPLKEVEKQQGDEGVEPTAVNDDNKMVTIDTLTEDSTGINCQGKGRCGCATIHTSFANQFLGQTNDLIDDFASALNKARKAFFPDFSGTLNTIITVIIIVVVVALIGTVLTALYEMATKNSTTSST